MAFVVISLIVLDILCQFLKLIDLSDLSITSVVTNKAMDDLDLTSD